MVSYSNTKKGTTMDTTDFYKKLEPISDFGCIFDSNYYQNVPSSWYIALTDVKNSTKAIENGKYKDVNIVGALAIISILNIDPSLDIPFVFGGDGAFILIPPILIDDTKQSLLSIQKLAKEAYSLDLRVGIVNVADIYKAEKSIKITKYKVSKEYSQAIIRGGGLEYADELLKIDNSIYIKDTLRDGYSANIEGLVCRWNSIDSPKDETLSLLIKAKDENRYEEILKKLDTILGDKANRAPIIQQNMTLSFKDDILDKQASLKSQNRFIKKILITWYKFMSFMGNFMMDSIVPYWKNYKKNMILSTDTEKFDDMLRMVVSTTYTETKELEEYLENLYKKGDIVYGIHKSNSSIITCFIYEKVGKHTHFVDASNGGYAKAAQMMKEKIKKV
jgi:hypothetical protein